MYHFCTYFDSNYLLLGLALHRSLQEKGIPFRLWVLCFDDRTYQVLNKLNLSSLIPVRLEDFEAGDADLLRVKPSRSKIEYYFTCSPSFPLYVLRQDPEIEFITYLDADLYFFADPSPLLESFSGYSISIVPHNFTPEADSAHLHGIYNVSFLSFRKDASGLECLNWWRERCIEWCSDEPEDGKFADQKYLDDWLERFSRVRVLQGQGSGIAPWNAARFSFKHDGTQLLVDDDTLVYFHFHGLRRVNDWVYDCNFGRYKARLTPVLRQYVYRPYLREINDVRRALRNSLADEDPNFHLGAVRTGIGLEWRRQGDPKKYLKQWAKNQLQLAGKLLRGDLLFTFDGNVF